MTNTAQNPLPATWKLSPVMLDCLRWFFGVRGPLLLSWTAATITALERRGLITSQRIYYKKGGNPYTCVQNFLTPEGLAFCKARGWIVSEGYAPITGPEPIPGADPEPSPEPSPDLAGPIQPHERHLLAPFLKPEARTRLGIQAPILDFVNLTELGEARDQLFRELDQKDELDQQKGDLLRAGDPERPQTPILDFGAAREGQVSADGNLVKRGDRWIPR